MWQTDINNDTGFSKLNLHGKLKRYSFPYLDWWFLDKKAQIQRKEKIVGNWLFSVLTSNP